MRRRGVRLFVTGRAATTAVPRFVVLTRRARSPPHGETAHGGIAGHEENAKRGCSCRNRVHHRREMPACLKLHSRAQSEQAACDPCKKPESEHKSALEVVGRPPSGTGRGNGLPFVLTDRP